MRKMTCKECHKCLYFDMCGYLRNRLDPTICTFFQPKSRFVELPCAFGDVIYMLVTRKTTSYDFKRENGTLKMIKQRNQHIFIKRTSFMKSNFFKVLDEIGKTVFLSREEAESALKEREKE